MERLSRETQPGTQTVTIGDLKKVPGYVSVVQTAQWKQQSAEYYNLKAYIPTNVIFMTPVVLVTYFLVRRALRSPHTAVHWLGGVSAIGAGLFGLFCVYFFLMLCFYGSPGKLGPGGQWVPEYDKKMTLQMASTLLGHEPRNAFQMQIGDAQLLANPEILLITYEDHYALVQAAAVEEIRKLRGTEIEAWRAKHPNGMLSFDPNGELVSFILNQPAYHEWGTATLGGFEVTLHATHPHGIWITREGFGTRNRIPEDVEMTNDVFLSRVMQALHP